MYLSVAAVGNFSEDEGKNSLLTSDKVESACQLAFLYVISA